MQSSHFGPSVPNIELKIDELILDGVPAAQRYQIADAVQRELAAQFEREGLPKSFRTSVSPVRDVVGGGTMSLAPGARADTIGGQLAGAIYQGITSDETPRGN
jgi:hypothetical protein